MSLSLIFWSTIVIAIVSFWWQSDKIKHFALQYVFQHCKQQNLQLLDQNLVLRGVRLARDEQDSLQIRRHYGFEFASTGSERYRGDIFLFGSRLYKIELEPYLIPDEENQL